jgi:hypothetical protein
LKYKVNIVYPLKKKNTLKSGKIRPFLYKEPEVLRSSRTTHNFYTKEPEKASEEKKFTIKSYFKSPLVNRYRKSKLREQNTKSTHSLHISKLSVRSIKDKVSRHTNESRNSIGLNTNKTEQESSQKTYSKSVFDRLNNDVKRRIDKRNTSAKSKLDSSRKSINSRSIKLGLSAFRPISSRNVKLKYVSSYIKQSEFHSKINSKCIFN